MKKQIFSTMASLVICFVAFAYLQVFNPVYDQAFATNGKIALNSVSVNTPIFTLSNHKPFKLATHSKADTYIGDVEDGSTGAYYQVYNNGYGGIAQIYFEDLYGNQGAAVYSFSGYIYGHAGTTWADVTVYPTSFNHFSYNGPLTF
jgi:hypothetical protein